MKKSLLTVGLLSCMLAFSALTVSADEVEDLPVAVETEAEPAVTVGWQKVDGSWYFYNESGVMQTGWIWDDGSWFYLNENGRMQTGWMMDDGSWFYFAENGRMATGWAKDNGGWYYFSETGRMQTGWIRDDGSWFYLHSGGRMATGWIQDDGSWFYLRENGRMATDWVKIDGTWYYMHSSGRMATGWQLVGGTWYYLESSGAMHTGWMYDGSSWYYLYDDGSMAAGEAWVNGTRYYFSGIGVYDSFRSSLQRRADGYTSPSNYLLLVDKSNFTVAVFTKDAYGWHLDRTFLCTVGAYGTETVEGVFSLGSKGYYFDSGSARLFYYSQIYGGYLFHSVLYYQTSTPQTIMDGTLGAKASHGCVRLALENAKWIYDYVPSGSTIVVYS